MKTSTVFAIALVVVMVVIATQLTFFIKAQEDKGPKPATPPPTLTCTGDLLPGYMPTARIITDTATGTRVLVVADNCAVVLPPIPSAPVEKPPASKGTEQ